MMARTFVKVSRSSYDVLGAAPTRSAPRPPDRRTARRMARGIASARPVRRLPFMRSSRCGVLYAARAGEGNIQISPTLRPLRTARSGARAAARRHRRGRRPAPRPDYPFHDAPLAVDEERLRVPPDLVAIADLMLGIDQ